MYAEKIILETDQHGRLLNIPILPANSQLEAIFLVLNQTSSQQRRKPSSLIAGKGKITGDIVSPIVDANDWDALQ